MRLAMRLRICQSEDDGGLLAGLLNQLSGDILQFPAIADICRRQ